MRIGTTFRPKAMAHGRFGERAFGKIRSHGFDAVDYNISETETELYAWDEVTLKANMQEEAARCRAAGLEIFQVHGPWRWPPQDATPQQREERMEKMKRSVLATELLGCRYLVVHPIMPFGVEELGTENAPKTWDLNRAFFFELLPFAKAHGVTVCLENMPMRRFSLATPEQILSFVEQMNDESLRICLDTGHVAVFPQLSVGDEVRRLGDLIKVLHVHDNPGDGDAHLPPKSGIIDWEDTARALREIGYGGVFSLETVPPSQLDDYEFEQASRRLAALCRDILI